MAKLSTMNSKNHQQAMDLVNIERPLTMTEKEFVLANYKPHAEHDVRKLQAFFTPMELAIAATIEMPNPDEYGRKIKVLDLCAGVGMLSFAYFHYSGMRLNTDNVELVCVEMTDEFIEVGKKVLPEATWIKADMFNLGHSVEIDTDFDCFISNPPYSIMGKSQILVGRRGAFLAGQIGMNFSEYGVMIILQNDCPFEYSGRDNYKETYNKDYQKVEDKALIRFAPSCVDTESVLDDNDEQVKWDGVKVKTEIVIVDSLVSV
jgi:hypothetical protein